MKELKLDELSRYGFAGGLFIVVLLISHPEWNIFADKATGLGETASLLGGSLLAGSLIYALHRAIAYRIMITIAFCLVDLFYPGGFDWTLLKPIAPSRTELRLDHWHLRMRQTNDQMEPYSAGWGAQVHLLYCSAWAILLGKLIAVVLRDPCNLLPARAYYIAATALFVAAFWHHLRLLVWIRENPDMRYPSSRAHSTPS